MLFLPRFVCFPVGAAPTLESGRNDSAAAASFLLFYKNNQHVYIASGYAKLAQGNSPAVLRPSRGIPGIIQ